MPKRPVSRDKNHKEIVTALKNAGHSVLDLAEVGSGCPDILVGIRVNDCQINLLMEIKSSFDAKIRPEQVEFIGHWTGQVSIVYSAEQALAVCEHFRQRYN